MFELVPAPTVQGSPSLGVISAERCGLFSPNNDVLFDFGFSPLALVFCMFPVVQSRVLDGLGYGFGLVV